jgi:16S rRNA G527 N7-methylase RsmG
MPIDEEEMDRIDLKHRLYTLLLDEKLFLAPIERNPQRILDLGTGSGKFDPCLVKGLD